MQEYQLLSIRIAKKDHKELKRIAVEEELSLNTIVYDLIKEYLKEKREQ